MLEMSRSEDMVIGINMENGEVMLLVIHGSDMVVGKHLARTHFGVNRFCSLSEPLYHISQSTIITPVLIYELHMQSNNDGTLTDLANIS